MSFIIAPTDPDWFGFHRQNQFNDKINFWTPTDWKFKALQPGEMVVFEMKGPGPAMIGGYGTFLEYKFQPIDDAWQEFGRRNGCESKAALIGALSHHKTFDPKQGIGCLALGNVIFFDNPVPVPNGIDFSRNTVKYSKYDVPFPFAQVTPVSSDFVLVQAARKKKKTQTVTQREGQAQFHTMVSIAYDHKCCISGEKTPELLQAAHIQDYISKESHHIQNGLLLRVDLHTLFDNGLLAIDSDYRIHISSLVQSPEYRKFDNMVISLPNHSSLYPSKDALKYKLGSFRK